MGESFFLTGLPMNAAPLAPDFQVDFSWIASAIRGEGCAPSSRWRQENLVFQKSLVSEWTISKSYSSTVAK